MNDDDDTQVNRLLSALPPRSLPAIPPQAVRIIADRRQRRATVRVFGVATLVAVIGGISALSTFDLPSERGPSQPQADSVGDERELVIRHADTEFQRASLLASSVLTKKNDCLYLDGLPVLWPESANWDGVTRSVTFKQSRDEYTVAENEKTVDGVTGAVISLQENDGVSEALRTSLGRCGIGAGNTYVYINN